MSPELMPMRVLNLVLRLAAAIALPGRRLDSQRGSQGCPAAGTLGEKPIAGSLEDAAAMLFDLAHDDFKIIADTSVRTSLVARHHCAVISYIEREKRR